MPMDMDLISLCQAFLAPYKALEVEMYVSTAKPGCPIINGLSIPMLASWYQLAFQ